MDGCNVPYRHTGKRGFDIGRQLCRQFINGSCRYGQRCYYLHEWPTVQSVQVCRYFQKGGCWFGDSCRYLHVAPCVDNGTSSGRRGSAPVVHASAFVGHTLTDRRGSEPSLLPRQGAHSWSRRGSEPLVTSLRQQSSYPTTDIAEEEEYAVASQPQDERRHLQQCGDPSPPQSPGSSSVGFVCNAASAEEKIIPEIGNQETSNRYGLESGAAASAERGQLEAYKQSKNVLCGICMDKVYEKATARERRFGILPNCSHAFCLGCIMTWRKTKDFQEEVIKACPQCRVKSSFYIPSKFWVGGGEPKAELIASFKAKSSKIKCNFFMHHGYCPFALECIFSHDLPPGHRPQRRRFRPKNTAGLLGGIDEDQRILSYFIALTLLDDEDLEFLDEYEIS